jgi:hypothetical protein
MRWQAGCHPRRVGEPRMSQRRRSGQGRTPVACGGRPTIAASRSANAATWATVPAAVQVGGRRRRSPSNPETRNTAVPGRSCPRRPLGRRTAGTPSSSPSRRAPAPRRHGRPTPPPARPMRPPATAGRRPSPGRSPFVHSRRIERFPPMRSGRRRRRASPASRTPPPHRCGATSRPPRRRTELSVREAAVRSGRRPA